MPPRLTADTRNAAERRDGLLPAARRFLVATFATLGAFRNFIVKNEEGAYEWKGGFAAVESAWRRLGAELVMTCQDTAETLPAHKMAVLLGRNRPLWNGLHKTVKEYLTRQDAEERTAELQAEIDRLRKITGGTTTGA